MKSSTFFLSELEEMNRSKFRVETANNGMWLQWLWHHLLVLLLEETGPTERVCKIQFVTRVCNNYPMLILHFFGMRIYNGKSLIRRNWNIVSGKRTKERYLSSGIRLTICWREALSIVDNLSNTKKLVNCNRRHSFSQYNEFSNLF